jgi:hypothetical protein
MTRTAKRAVIVASVVVAATAIAVAHGVSRIDDDSARSTVERYDAYDGGPVPIRKLYEPIEPMKIIGLPRAHGHHFGTAHMT